MAEFMGTPTDFEQQQLDLMQRRGRYAKQQELNMPGPGQMVGNRFVATNPLNYLAEGLRAYGAQRGEENVRKELTDLAGKKQEALAKALRTSNEYMTSAPAVPEKSDTFGSEEGDYKMVTQDAQPARAADPFKAASALIESNIPALQTAGINQQMELQKQRLATAQQQQHLGILSKAQTPQEAIAAGVPIDTVKGYYESKNYGRTKAGRSIEVEGPGGVKMIQQVDEYGVPMGAPMPGYMPAQAVNTGNAVTFAKPVAGQSFNVSMSPGETARLNQSAYQFNQTQNAPVFNADAGGFVYKPTAQAPQGGVVKVEGVGNKPLTEGQSKAVAFGTRMQNSDKILNDLGLSGTNAIIPGANSAVMNPLLSKNQQKAVQAQRDFVNATLRRESGAVISDQEFDNAAKQYFPQVGDSKEVIAQKAQNRKIAIGGIQADIPQSSRNLPNQIIQNSTPKPTGSGNIDSLLDKYK